MKIWIDLANSPHSLLFAPLVERFRGLGHDVLVTARDNAQTLDLARAHVGGDVVTVGGASPAGRVTKAWAIAARTAGLVRRARAWRADVALSHNSYAQIVAAAALRIPIVTAMDYEHQPANHLAFRLASRVLLPVALPRGAVARQGATAKKVVTYPGLKEELYVGCFEPDPHVLDGLGVDGRDERLLVIARTPPTGASYHQFGNPRFVEALRVLSNRGDVTCVVLPRRQEQAGEIETLGLDGVVTARRALDSRSLMLLADAFVGAGGTMTREAAILGVPTYSVFAGPRSHVDVWLEQEGSLHFVESASQVAELAKVGRRPPTAIDLKGLRTRAKAVEDVFVSTTITAGESSL
jgi:predicted glycosyltransferase